MLAEHPPSTSMTRKAPMKPMIVTASAAVTLLLTLTACSGGDTDDTSDDASSEPRTGVLANSEFGLADGSTTEVPFDASVLSSGPQEDLTTPATVLVSGITSDAQEIEFTAQVEIDEIIEGSVDDLDLDAENLATLGDAVPYYVEYTASYVNGPVAQQPDVQFFAIDDASGADLDSGVFLTFGTIPEGTCDDIYKAQAFGEGAQTRGCAMLFLSPGEPASLRWTFTSPTTPVAEPVSWPIG